MKRALAERAKQSGLPNGVGTATNRPIQEKSMPSSHVAPSANGHIASVPAAAEASTNTANHSSRSNSSSSSSSSSIPKKPFVPKPQTTLSSSQPPQKVSEVQVKKPLASLKTKMSQVRSPRNASASPRPKKRARESLVKLEEEDEDDSNKTSFYLRHQNRALASELRLAKYQLTRLEREREHRRGQCLQAVESLNDLYIRWKTVEVALEHQKKNPKTIKIKIPSSDAPLSTGSGQSVEWIGALMNSLTRIGTAKASRLQTKGNFGGANGKEGKPENGEMNTVKIDADAQEQVDSQDEAEALEDEECLGNIMNVAEKMSERFSLLQSWISALLQNLDKSNVPINGQMHGQSWSPPTTLELQNQVARVEAENITLQELVKELTRSRDEMVESDRRVRRGLYRLAAGRVKLKEVLKAVANADEDKESAAAWMETSTAGASKPSAPSQEMEDTKVEKGGDDKSPISSKEIEQLKKQLADLDTLASSRNKQIKKVRSVFLFICSLCWLCEKLY